MCGEPDVEPRGSLEEILIEEYLEGPEISLETLTFDGVTIKTDGPIVSK